MITACPITVFKASVLMLLLLFLSVLMIIPDQSGASPSRISNVRARMINGLNQREDTAMNDDDEIVEPGSEDEDDGINDDEENDGKDFLVSYRMADQKRQRQLSRDTFLRLDPNSRRNRDRDAAIGSTHREREEDGHPLFGGDTLFALTSADTISGMAPANNCRGDLFKHKVRVAGCRPKSIVNRFCHGSCASFYIPRLRSKKLKATFQSCAACVPAETDLIQVRLDCPGRDEGDLYRTVVRVKRCACRNIVLEEEEEREATDGSAEKEDGTS